MGTNRRDADAYNVDTQYDDTEFPQRHIWLDEFEIDQYEATLGEYLAFLYQHKRKVSDELQELIWHLIDVHFIPDEVLAPWPALYVTWEEAFGVLSGSGKAFTDRSGMGKNCTRIARTSLSLGTR